MIIKVGSIVQMTEEYKTALLGPCVKRGYHYDNGPEEFCVHCSGGHVKEFGNSVGRVLAIDVRYGDVEVNWLPGNLHHSYLQENLQLTKLKAFI